MIDYLELARRAMGKPTGGGSNSSLDCEKSEKSEESSTHSTAEVQTPAADLRGRLRRLLAGSERGLTDAEVRAALLGVDWPAVRYALLDLCERGEARMVCDPGDEWRWQARAPRPLEAAIRFDVPGVGDVWLVPSTEDAERLGLPDGTWLTPGDLMLLEGLAPDDRVEVLRIMRTTGGRLLTAPAPRGRFGTGEAGWYRWRAQNLERQCAEYRCYATDRKGG